LFGGVRLWLWCQGYGMAVKRLELENRVKKNWVWECFEISVLARTSHLNGRSAVLSSNYKCSCAFHTCLHHFGGVEGSSGSRTNNAPTIMTLRGAEHTDLGNKRMHAKVCWNIFNQTQLQLSKHSVVLVLHTIDHWYARIRLACIDQWHPRSYP
jgi:hypothetical protein